jgi:hypothetical protein
LRLVAMAALMAGGGAVPAAEATKPPKPAAAAKPAGKSARKAPAQPTLPQALPEQIDAAGRVYYGAYECEFNQGVTIAKSEKHAAYVDVRSGKSTWLMKPVLSTTGAVRLEDVKGQTLMVQIASKSMLLNVKTSRRIVDECVSARQRELIAEAKAAEAAASATGQAASAPQAAASSAQPPASAAASASSPTFEPAASAASPAASR